MYIDKRMPLRKAELIGVLERLCVGFELTDTQYSLAKSRYEGVGRWLAEAASPLLRTVSVYLQGSTALGTTVKPIGQNEHDVDLVCHMPNLSATLSPPIVKKLIGDRLRENGNYASLLEEKARCWRLNYANEFHMDITPAIPNPTCVAGGELVPDKELRGWKASNPKGYKALFDRRALLVPRMRYDETIRKAAADSAHAKVEPYPETSGFKGVLRRTVQILKRHRDEYFLRHDSGLAPISVIVTTLASQSYEYCVQNFVYDNELDLLCDVVRHMPGFIGHDASGGRLRWFIWNETTEGENFSEKWNSDSRLATAFYGWHTQALTDLENLPGIDGIDNLTRSINASFGQAAGGKAIQGMIDKISTARRTGQLTVSAGAGLSVSPISKATPVRSNTFYGAE